MDTLELVLARNEYEAAQIVLTVGKQPVEKVKRNDPDVSLPRRKFALDKLPAMGH